MLNGSHIIKGRWKIMKKIGQGAFGEIYQAKNILTNEMVAIKVERVDSKKQVLKLEVAVLKKLQDSNYVCRFITCGRFSDYNYMVMELLGENLSEWRRKQVDGKFSLSTTIKLGQQMLRAIEAVHQLGYLHRDIKPSNFVMGLSANKRKIAYLIDFGLARRFVMPTGEVRPARDTAGFRGTARYASINSHLSKDLGRRDDLWSLFYVLIEFVKGYLPWRKLKDKDQIGEMKKNTNPLELISELPKEFELFMNHLDSLDYMDKPDYKYLQTLLLDMYHQLPSNDNNNNANNDVGEIIMESNTTQVSVSTRKEIPISNSETKKKTRSKYSQDNDDNDDNIDNEKIHIELGNGEELREDDNISKNKENEKKILNSSANNSLLRQTTDIQFYKSQISGRTSLFPELGEFKSPLMVITQASVLKQTSYVSSNMDENGAVPPSSSVSPATNKMLLQHRRCSSLPVTLSAGNIQGNEKDNSNDITPGTLKQPSIDNSNQMNPPSSPSNHNNSSNHHNNNIQGVNSQLRNNSSTNNRRTHRYSPSVSLPFYKPKSKQNILDQNYGMNNSLTKSLGRSNEEEEDQPTKGSANLNIMESKSSIPPSKPILENSNHDQSLNHMNTNTMNIPSNVPIEVLEVEDNNIKTNQPINAIPNTSNKNKTKRGKLKRSSLREKDRRSGCKACTIM